MTSEERSMLEQLEVLRQRLEALAQSAAQPPTDLTDSVPASAGPGTARGEALHKLNNVISGIYGHAQLSLRRLPANAQGRAPLQTLADAADRVGGLTRHVASALAREDLLGYVADLASAVGDVVAALRVVAGEPDAASGSPSEVALCEASQSLPARRGASTTVLIIDDEALVRSSWTRLLADAGFDVLPAASGPEGLELFRANADRVSLVLLDLTMPHMDGEATLLALRALSRDVPVLLVSGYRLDVTRWAGDARLVGVLQKPCSAEDVLRAVTQALERSSSASRPGSAADPASP
jgi:CheY-like chemotaxis protein